MCRFDYTSKSEDLKYHRKLHEKIAVSYDRTMKHYQKYSRPVPWHGRPSTEDIGTYLALNTLNPRMIGFRMISSLEKVDLNKLQDNDGEIVPFVYGGDGHDRGGLWLTSDGRVFKYEANWRCGMANFRAHQQKESILDNGLAKKNTGSPRSPIFALLDNGLDTSHAGSCASASFCEGEDEE
jgi:hypothetical protein